jgi:hypothetical protein
MRLDGSIQYVRTRRRWEDARGTPLVTERDRWTVSGSTLILHRSTFGFDNVTVQSGGVLQFSRTTPPQLIQANKLTVHPGGAIRFPTRKGSRKG